MSPSIETVSIALTIALPEIRVSEIKLFFMATVMSSALAVLLALRISAIRRYLYEVFYGQFHYGHSFHTPE